MNSTDSGSHHCFSAADTCFQPNRPQGHLTLCAAPNGRQSWQLADHDEKKNRQLEVALKGLLSTTYICQLDKNTTPNEC